MLPASELVRAYRAGRLSPVEVTEACLGRIEAYGEAVGAFVLVDPEAALAAARASETRWARGEPRGLVDGVPATIKDILLAKGWPTRRGSLTSSDEPAADDAPSVARLRKHGAVFLGKTTTPEFGWKAVTDNPFGQIARNPWNTSRTAGGSSGGAAAAAALGMGALHIGTDGGGSIRIPAGFCGIVGFKGSYGRVPAWPVSPFGPVAHIGPMTRTVEDAALMLTVMSAFDPRDPEALPMAPRDWRLGLKGGVAGMRIAASVDLGQTEVMPDISAAFDRALSVLRDLGATVDEIATPFASTRDLFARTWFPMAAHMVRALSEAQRHMLDPGLIEIAEEGSRLDAAGLFEVQAERRALAIRMQEFFDGYDLLVTPTLPLTAFEAGLEVPDRTRYPRWIDWAPFSNPFNLTRQPAVSVPCGFDREGLPIGLQIVGPLHEDGRVLRAARAFEAASPQPMADQPRAAREA